ncbi:MAG TPA: DUF2259 domain-containing protein [Treponemataceae bacterium]|nr:DUF2259 domain-containing protein [Treponemataceae bacterium]
MRKLSFIVLVALLAVSGLSAGDVATFVNLGFSPGGERFLFGQYGVSDGDFRPYAEIYGVDVAKNDFLPGAVFKKTFTGERDGKKAFESLRAESGSSVRGIDPSLQGRALYVQAVDEPELKYIAFRDFETGVFYAVTLNALVEGKGTGVRSSFYLSVEMTLADGKVVRKTVGLPGYKRAGVKDYLVRRIIVDESGKSLVFVIEKRIEAKGGDSIRFMVETVRL